ncbi:hypothetical protein P792_09985 [Asaia sp. SF2.1]|nr:hypothetical protein P792_09985 [Asaia sp. SF2.1]
MCLDEVPQGADRAFTAERPVPVEAVDLPVPGAKMETIGTPLRMYPAIGTDVSFLFPRLNRDLTVFLFRIPFSVERITNPLKSTANILDRETAQAILGIRIEFVNVDVSTQCYLPRREIYRQENSYELTL